MQGFVKAIISSADRRGVAGVDGPAARLALLTVVELLPMVLDEEEVNMLAARLPRTLSLLLSGHPTPDPEALRLVDHHHVRMVCAVLGLMLTGRHATRMRHDVPSLLRDALPRLVGSSTTSAGDADPDETPTWRPPAPAPHAGAWMDR